MTNFIPHPTNEEYVVFMFHDERMSAFFENKLIENSVKFEKDRDEENDPPRDLFAVRRTRFDQVLQYNYESHGKFRKPLFRNGFWRWFVILFVLILTIIALYANSIS